jgi:hypothetical protein
MNLETRSHTTQTNLESELKPGVSQHWNPCKGIQCSCTIESEPRIGHWNPCEGNQCSHQSRLASNARIDQESRSSLSGSSEETSKPVRNNFLDFLGSFQQTNGQTSHPSQRLVENPCGPVHGCAQVSGELAPQ